MRSCVCAHGITVAHRVTMFTGSHILSVFNPKSEVRAYLLIKIPLHSDSESMRVWIQYESTKIQNRVLYIHII